MNAPLAGKTVIEASSYISGPMAAMILADLGADVTKVEPPRGDPYRRFGSRYDGTSLEFRATNQNKSSVALDLKTEAGVEALFELLKTADVFITNWRPSVAPGLGITAELIRERFPQLIWVRVSGYGQHGPQAELPAYDAIVQARSGYMLSGIDVPARHNNSVADKVSAMFAAQTATSALIARTESGTGAVCDVAMIDAMAYFYGADISAGHRMADAEPDLGVSARVNARVVFETGDGYIVLSPLTGHQLRRSLEAVGKADKFSYLMDGAGDILDRFVEVVTPELLTKSAAEWEAVFAEADVPAAAARDFGAHLGDAQIQHNETYRTVQEPGLGAFRAPRFPGLFNAEPARKDSSGSPPRPELAD